MKKWTKEEDNLLKSNYGINSRKYVAQLLNRTESSCVNRAKKLCLLRSSKSKFEFDDNCFSIPTIENCYWAGLLAADGCIRNKPIQLNLGLKHSDRNHLQRFLEFTKHTGSVKDRLSNGYPFSVVEICGCKSINYDLNHNFNITSRKSLTLKPPIITDCNLQKSFITGYLDGDGCIRLDEKNRLEISCVGTIEMTTWIQEIFDSMVEPQGKHHAIARKIKNKNYSEYKITGYRAAVIAGELLQLNTPKLLRKWIVVRDYICKEFVLDFKKNYVSTWIKRFLRHGHDTDHWVSEISKVSL